MGVSETRAGLGVREIKPKLGVGSYLLNFLVGAESLGLQRCLRRDGERVGVAGRSLLRRKLQGEGGVSGTGLLPILNPQVRFEMLWEGCGAGNPWPA